MKAVVVYESLWGNTAAIARAIAEGIGPDAAALSTDEATGDALAGADLVVAGAPLLGFNLPTESATPPTSNCHQRSRRPEANGTSTPNGTKAATLPSSSTRTIGHGAAR